MTQPTNVRLITEERQDALVLPEQALVPFGSEQFVFRIVDGKAQRARVEIGQRGDGRVEVRQGVGPEDVVVVAGQLKLRDGVPVTLSRPAAQAAAGNGKAAAPQASATSGAPVPPAAPDARPANKG